MFKVLDVTLEDSNSKLNSSEFNLLLTHP